MNKRQAKIEALAQVCGSLDADLGQPLFDDLPRKDQKKVVKEYVLILNRLYERLLRLENGSSRG